jgi:iron complex transport system substrate-binding protein
VPITTGPPSTAAPTEPSSLEPATTPSSSEPADPGADFPVTIEHKYGETTITEQPERVVSVGFADQDPLLALGVVPVGIRDWYGDQPNATWPWASDELGDADPVVLPLTELNFEQISALDPDLIVGISSGMTRRSTRPSPPSRRPSLSPVTTSTTACRGRRRRR